MSDQFESHERETAAMPAVLIWAPLTVAAAATMGSVWLSTQMLLKACPLCFYQRTFAMSVFTVLAIGLLLGKRHWSILPVLAFPLAIAGFGVAAFHVNLELSGKLECPAGVFGIGTAPQQSGAVFTLLVAALLVSLVRSLRTEPKPMLIGFGILLGVVLAVASVISAPPLPPKPTKPYDFSPPDTCRPPFRPQ